MLREKIRNIAAIVALATLLAGCSAAEPIEPDYTSESIAFGVGGVVGSELTRTPITDYSQLRAATTTTVNVYGQISDDAISYSDLANYTNAPLAYNQTGIWSLASGNNATWTEGKSYRFWAYAFSPTTAITDGLLVVENEGRDITLSQPVDYSVNGTVDYLLSHLDNRFKSVPAKGNLVVLQLEHAMALVELNVTKTAGSWGMYVDKLEVKNFRREVSTVESSQAEYGSGERNRWNFVPSGTADTVYGLYDTVDIAGGDYTTDYEVAVSATDTEAKMLFCAVPQSLDNAQIYIHFWSNDKQKEDDPDMWIEHEAIFNLSDYGTRRWSTATKTKYLLKLDTGIHLSALVEDWVPVDFIQGTILPEIK